jgi:tetratricopeptide (TPR) repeat protein
MLPQEQFDEAVRLEAEGQQERALGLWRQLDPRSSSRNVFLRLASIAQKLGLIEDAEAAFKEALRIDDRSALALRGMGILAIDRASIP